MNDQLNSAAALPEEWGERISAYLDGELSPEQTRQVESRLAEDPAAARWAEELRALRRMCQHAPQPVVGGDLAAAVVAEALKRQAAGEGSARVEVADRLEPEGEFGLPFGKASRNWAWAVVAAAAAVLIGFYGRPGATTAGPTVAQRPTSQQIELGLARMRRVAPDLREVKYQVTPAGYARLRQYLAQRASQPSVLPGALQTVSQRSGVSLRPVEPALLGSSEATEEVLCLDADEAELDRLLQELEREDGESVVRVAQDRPATKPSANPAPGVKSRIRGVWRVQLNPEAVSAQQGVGSPVSQGDAGRRFIVLRIQVSKQP